MRRLWLTGRVYDIIQLSSNFMKDSYLYLCTNFPRSSVAFFFFFKFFSNQNTYFTVQAICKGSLQAKYFAYWFLCDSYSHSLIIYKN